MLLFTWTYIYTYIIFRASNFHIRYVVALYDFDASKWFCVQITFRIQVFECLRIWLKFSCWADTHTHAFTFTCQVHSIITIVSGYSVFHTVSQTNVKYICIHKSYGSRLHLILHLAVPWVSQFFFSILGCLLVLFFLIFRFHLLLLPYPHSVCICGALDSVDLHFICVSLGV